MPELVHLTTADGVARVVLDSPRNRNALSRQLVGELVDRLAAAADDAAVKTVVIAAEGPVFCSGADLSEAADGGMADGAWALVALQRQIIVLPKPVVVRLHGPVRAGGLGIVGAADIVLAAASVSFAFSEVRLALAPAAISLTTLPRLTDRAAALAYLTGGAFGAAEAARIGLVTRAVPDEELDAAVDDVVAELAKAAPQGLRETKLLLTAALRERIDASGETVADKSAELFASDEAREAMMSFLERKKR